MSHIGEEVHTVKVPPNKLLLPNEVKKIETATKAKVILSEDGTKIYIHGEGETIDRAMSGVERKMDVT